jgi:hypothetical protein
LVLEIGDGEEAGVGVNDGGESEVFSGDDEAGDGGCETSDTTLDGGTDKDSDEGEPCDEEPGDGGDVLAEDEFIHNVAGFVVVSDACGTIREDNGDGEEPIQEEEDDS